MTRGGARAAAVGCAALLALTACSGQQSGTRPQGEGPSVSSSPTAASAPASASGSSTPSEPARPLEGRLIVLDPGHQLGNQSFPTQVNRLVPDGAGGRKPCNTTGTATDAGYPEATFNWQVAVLVRAELTDLGARVRLTRASNSARRWGPCVDVRGRAGNPDGGHQGADLKLSIHADGAASSTRGFHLVVPGTGGREHLRASRRLAIAVRAGLGQSKIPRSPVQGEQGEQGIVARDDLATVSLARVPVVLAELGNMRNPEDAALMVSAQGQRRYARALAHGIVRFLRR